MTPLRIFSCSVALAVASCGGSSSGDDGDDTGDDQPDAPVSGVDGPIPDAAVADARPDTCPVASGAFAVDVPPPPGTNTNQHHAVLQVPAAGDPAVLVSRLYQNGSFFDANLFALTRTAPTTWNASTLANGGIGLSIARNLAATHGADPCVAYSDDYNGYLHLRCPALGDRVVAPAITSSLSLATDGTTRHLVYVANDNLVWQPYTTSPGTAEPIEAAWEHGPSAVAIGPTGTVHVVYVVHDEPQTGVPHTRQIRYARRDGAGTWQLETVATDGWIDNEGDSIALALIGDEPVIAFHQSADHGLHLARRSGGAFTLATLLAPDPGFDNDTVGRGVAIAVDCYDRIHVAYERMLTTDPQPDLGLHVAQVTAAGLADDVAVPMTASTAYHYAAWRHSLGLYVDAAGHQYVAAELSSIFGAAAYFATR